MSDQMIRTASGLEFHCRIEGPPGAPWLMLSNSFMTNLSLWDSFAAHMSDRFRVVRYDQRGHGASTVAPPPYQMSELTQDALEIMDALGIERAHFVGISMGGAVGWGLAQGAPNRLLSLTACDCAIAGSSPKEWAARHELVRQGGMAALVEQTVGRWFTARSIEAGVPAVDLVRAMIATTPVDGFAGGMAALSSFDVSRDLEGINLPVLLVAGAEDGQRPVTMAADCMRVAGARLEIIPDAGHLSNIENPAAFNAVVGAFLDGVARQ